MGTIAVVAVGMLVLRLRLRRVGRTPVGTTVAADFPQFYVAAGICLIRGRRSLRPSIAIGTAGENVPGGDWALPYAYPPVVAYLFRPLTYFSYTAAAGIFVFLVAVFYGVGILALWESCENIPREGKVLGVLICLAFEPFAFECLHGGQVSTFAFMCVCLAILFDRRGRAVLCGVCLGLLAYKPPLLAILLPTMVLGRRWRRLGGCVGMILVGVIASVVLVGEGALREFFRMAGTYGNAVAGNDGFRTWKYVDLSAFLRMLHLPGDVAFVVPMLGILTAAIFLSRRFDWGTALAATLVLNLYAAVYDSVLIVPAFWLAADALYKREGELTLGYRRLATAVFLAPWVSPAFAVTIGFQLYTVVLGAALVWFAGYDMRRSKSTDLESVSVAASLHH